MNYLKSIVSWRPTDPNHQKQRQRNHQNITYSIFRFFVAMILFFCEKLKWKSRCHRHKESWKFIHWNFLEKNELFVVHVSFLAADQMQLLSRNFQYFLSLSVAALVVYAAVIVLPTNFRHLYYHRHISDLMCKTALFCLTFSIFVSLFANIYVRLVTETDKKFAIQYAESIMWKIPFYDVNWGFTGALLVDARKKANNRTILNSQFIYCISL